MNRAANRRRRQAGMSLTELLVGVAVAAIFGTLLMMFLVNGTSTASGLENQRRVLDQSQKTQRFFVRDVRRSVGPTDGVNPVISVTGTQIQLYADLTTDAEATRPSGQHGPRPSIVRYWTAAHPTIPSTSQLFRAVRPVSGTTYPFTWGTEGVPELLVEVLANTDVFTAIGESVADPLAGQTFANPVNASLLDDIRTIRLRLLLPQRHVNATRNLEITTDATLR